MIEYLNFIYFVTEMAEAGNTYQLEPEKDEM